MKLNIFVATKIILILLCANVITFAQIRPRVSGSARRTISREQQIAAQFAPVIYQGLGEQPRFDYITNFDFDGDWKGDNNWVNAENKNYVLRANVYYALVETTTHYFVFYAFFHPRDYKGGLAKSSIVDALIKEGLRRAGKDPTGLADDVALSHENDLEGCLVVAEKRGDNASKAVLQFVETMAHNRYYKLRSAHTNSIIGEIVEAQEQHPLLFAEPKGHGVFKYSGDKEQTKKSVKGVLQYRYAGNAEDPEKAQGNLVGYDLLPLYDTFWQRAQTGENEMYGEALEFEPLKILSHNQDGKDATIERNVGKIGISLLGNVGFKNKARALWGWYDDTEKERPRGEWFFNPAAVIARHFGLDQNFSQTYIYHPFLKIGLNER